MTTATVVFDRPMSRTDVHRLLAWCTEQATLGRVSFTGQDDEKVTIITAAPLRR